MDDRRLDLSRYRRVQAEESSDFTGNWGHCDGVL